MKNVTKQVALLLVFYFLLRLGFFLYHWREFGAYSTNQIANALLFGLRYDLASIALINGAIFVAQVIFPGFALQFLQICFYLSNSAFFWLNLFDIEYFNFSGQRLTYAQICSLARDIQRQGPGLFLYYWPYALAAVFFLYLFYRAQRPLWRLSANKKKEKRIWQRSWQFFVVLLFSGFAIRGGLQRKPLSPTHALLVGDRMLAILALNSTYSFLRSFNDAQLIRQDFFATQEDCIKVLDSNNEAEIARLPKNTNVVLIVLESFSLEYMGREKGSPSYTPFLNELAEKGIFFPRHFANGRTSIEALPALLAQIPSLMGQSFITSPYTKVKLNPIPQILAKNGYYSAFFHGGYTGTMYFDALAKLFGFNRYYGAEDFPGHDERSNTDGQWGVMDEPFLLFVAKELTQLPEPFFTTIFTLSSHHPYKIPEGYTGHFPKGTLEIHESIGYADYALRQFFLAAREHLWYSNTLFVLTADHTSKSESPLFSDNIGHYRVPLIFWHPKLEISFLDNTSISSHVDIAPTIFALLGTKLGQRNLLGTSLASKRTSRSVILRVGDVFLLLADNAALEFDLGGKRSYSLWEDAALRYPMHEDQMLNLGRGYLQYFFNGLLDGTLLVGAN